MSCCLTRNLGFYAINADNFTLRVQIQHRQMWSTDLHVPGSGVIWPNKTFIPSPNRRRAACGRRRAVVIRPPLFIGKQSAKSALRQRERVARVWGATTLPLRRLRMSTARDSHECECPAHLTLSTLRPLRVKISAPKNRSDEVQSFPTIFRAKTWEFG